MKVIFILKLLRRSLFTDYKLYLMYSCLTSRLPRPDATSLLCYVTDYQLLAEAELESKHVGEVSVGFGTWLDLTWVSARFYWHADRCGKRCLWPLCDAEPRVVQTNIVSTAQVHRVATVELNIKSAEWMLEVDFERFYAQGVTATTPRSVPSRMQPGDTSRWWPRFCLFAASRALGVPKSRFSEIVRQHWFPPVYVCKAEAHTLGSTAGVLLIRTSLCQLSAPAFYGTWSC
jgi:hypothetical protein